MQNENQQSGVVYSGDTGVQVSPSVSTPVDPVLNTGALSMEGGEEASPEIVEQAAQLAARRTRRERLIRWGSTGAVALLLFVVVGLVVKTRVQDNGSVVTAPAANFEKTKIPLEPYAVEVLPTTQSSQTVTINGVISLKSGMVLAPSFQPSAAQPGQLYYDQGTNLLGYFNGTEFVFLDGKDKSAATIPDNVVEQIAGLTGQVPLGPGLAAVGGQLVNSGVLTVQGQAGNVTFAAGSGIGISGTTITNTGVVSVASSSPSLVVTNDGNGNLTLTPSGSGTGTVASSGGTSGRITKFTGSQTIEDSLLSESGTTITVNGDLTVTGTTTLSSPLSVTNGGTGTNALAGNGVLIGHGTSAITSIVAGASGLCLVSTGGAPTWATCNPPSSTVNSLNGLTGTLTIANATGLVNTITIDDASTSSKGIAQFNGTNFSVVGGNVNTIQNISTGSSPTFNSLTLSGNLTVQGGTSTLGTLTQAGSIIISDGSSNTVTIVADNLSANRIYTLPDAGGDATLCVTAGNCIGGGGSAPNTADYLVTTLSGVLTNERALANGSNIVLTDGGANANLTVATVQNPTFTTSVTTPQLQSSGALVISSAGGNTVAIDSSSTIELQDSTNVTGSLDVSVALNVGTANAFAVNASGAITAAAGITSSGAIVFSGLDCTLNANGGALTTNGSGQLICSDDDGGAGGGISGAGTSGTVPLFNGTSSITNSIITQSGTTITVAGDLILTTDLTVSNGGTGASSFTSNGLLYGNGSGALQVTAAGTSGQVMIANGSGVPTFVSFSGDIAVAANGATTIQANSVALGTDTTGDYVSNIGTLNGLSTSGNSGEGSTPTLSVLYGSIANTAVQGNVTLTCPAGTGNLTGGGESITLGIGGSCGSLSTVNDPTFSTSVTTPNLTFTGAGSDGQIVIGNLGQGTVYTLPDPGQAAVDICLSTGNCATAGAAGGDLTGTYPNPTIAKLQGTGLDISSPLAGHILVYNATNSAWENHAISSDIAISETGVATIQSDAVALGTDTTGNYAIGLTAGNGVSVTGTPGEGWSPSVAVLYGSSANTAVEGSTSITVSAGTNLTGGGAITLGAGGTVTLNVANSPTFSGTLAVQGATATIGTSSQQGSVVLNDGSSNTGTIQTAPLAANRIFTLPDPGSDATICVSTGNCATAGAAGGDLTGTYPNPTIAALQNTTLTISSVTSGNILQYNGSAWVNQSLSGDVTLNSSGVATIQANSVALGTDTTGDYVANFGTLTGLSTSGNSGEGSTPTLSVVYGSGANNSVQGNTSITVSAGTNLTGGGSITLGAGGTVTLDVANSPTFSGTLAVQGASVTVGGASQLGSLILNDGSSNIGTIRTASLGQDTIYTLPDPGGDATICVDTGNCAGVGGGVTTAGGTTDYIPKFTGSQTIGDSLLSDDGSTVTINGSGNFVVQGGTATLGTLSQSGTLAISDGSSNTISIVAAGVSADRTFTLPETGGPATFCMSTGNCIGGGGGGAPSDAEYLVLSLHGSLSNERSIVNGSNISFTDGGANGNLTVATVQNPTFTTSVTTPTLQSSGALAISSGSGSVTIDATTTIELQDSTNVTGVLDVSASLNVGTANAFVVSSGGAITAATGITSSGTITFSGLDCTTYANGGTVTTNGSGVLSCADDDGAPANTITGTGTNGTIALFNGTNSLTDSVVTQSGSVVTITGSLTLTTDLAVTDGGTGASSFTSNGVLYGNGSGALNVTAAGTSGQVLVADGSGVPTFVSFSGDVAVAANGTTTIQANSVALGTDTTGDYVTNIGTLTGLSTSGNSGEGSTPTLSVIYGSSANTAVQGDTTITCPSGTGNLTGGGTSITLGTGGTCGNLNTINNPTFSTSVSTPSLIVTGAGSNGTLQVANLGQPTTFTLPDPGVGSATICVSTGNCATAGTAGGDLTGTYPNPTIASLQGTTLDIDTPTAGHVLIYNGTNTAWENHAVSGDIAISETGVATIQANSVALGTDTTGDYVANIGTVTGLTVGGNSGEGSTPTLSVNYGSSANTAVQGNTSITVTAGTNLTGGGSITLGAGGTVTLDVANSPTFSGTLTVQGATATIGTTSVQGSLVLHDGAGETATIQSATPLGQSTIYTLPDPGQASADICLSTGNCTAVGSAGGDLTGSYPSPTIASLQGTTLTLSSVSTGNILQFNGTAWVNQSISGDIALNSSGVATIQANSVALGTDTTGDYVANIGTVAGLSVTGNSGEGSTPALSVLYGSSANTAVQGNTTLTCPSGTGNLSGGGTSITLGTGGTCGDLTITNSPTFTGTLTVSTINTTSALAVGNVAQSFTLQGNATSVITADDSGNTTTVGFATPTADTTISFPALTAGSYTVCTSSGNCGGVGATLQTAYDNSTNPEIVLNGTNGALTVRDASSPIGANLLEVQNNAASTTYFAVTAGGIQTTGTNVSSGNVNTTGGAVQTNSVTRIDNSGNLTNIGTITSDGVVLHQNTTNSTTAFQIQNASSLPSFNIDTTTPNLITNHSIEAGTTGWAAIGSATISQLTTDSRDGTKSLKVAVTAANGGVKYTYALASSTQYSFSIWGKRAPSGTFSTIEMGRSEDGSTNTSCTTGQQFSSDNWARRTCTFTTGTVSGTTYLYLRQSDATVRDWYIDAIQLETGATVTPYRNGLTDVSGRLRVNAASSADLATVFIQGAGGGGDVLSVRGSGENDLFQAILNVRKSDGTSLFNVGDTANGSNFTGGSSFFDSAALTVSAMSSGVRALDVKGASGQTADIVRIKDSSSNTLFSVGAAGAVTSQNATNSTAAFQIQNQTGGSLMLVDSSYSNMTLLGVTSGGFGSAWTTTSSILGTGLTDAAVVTANGYMYTIGGRTSTSTSTVVTTVNYAKINADGSVGTWSTTTALPAGRALHAAVVANGFVYVIGGANPIGTPVDTTYYAKINADGTLGTWNTTTVYPGTIQEAPAVFLNGYMYVVAGWYNGFLTDDVRYARVNPDGSLGSWSTVSNATNGIPSSRTSGAAVAANGVIYFSGGNDNATRRSEIYYARPDPTTGDISSAFSTGTSLTNPIDQHGMVSSNGYLYAIGGRGQTATDISQTTIYRTTISSTGAPGSWTSSGTDMPALNTGRARHGTVLVNGYIYAVGGTTGSSGSYSTTNSLERISTSRVKIGASLDLVGLQYAGSLVDDGSYGASSAGGSITAGSGTFIGGMTIQGQTSLLGSLSVAGIANFSGGLSVGAIDTTGTLLVLDTKTGTGDPTGVDGAMYYNATYGRFRCYQNGAWVDCISGSPKEYLRGEMRTVQSTAGEIDAGDHIKFASVQASAGGSISLDTTSAYVDSASTAASVGRITLAAGKTYRLVGNIPYMTCTGGSTNCEANFTWYNVTGGAQLGNTAIISANTMTASDAREGYAEAIFTPSVSSLVELRIVVENSVTGFGYITPPQLLYPNFYIEVLDSGGSGGASAAEYMRAELSAAQSSDKTTNDHLKFNTVAASSGSSITLDTTTTYTNAGGASVGRFTLAAGKTYRLSGNLMVVFGAADSQATFRWYNVTAGQYIGTSAYTNATNRNDVTGNMTTADGVFTPSANTLVELRIEIVGIGSIASIANNSTAFIEVLNDGTKIAQFQGATASVAGQAGYVPAPAAGQEGSLLVGDGSWSSGMTFLNTTTSRGLKLESADNAFIILRADSDNDGSEVGQPYIGFLADGSSTNTPLNVLGQTQIAGFDPAGNSITGALANSMYLGAGNTNLQFGTNSNVRLSISSAGDITIGASDTTGALLVLDTKTSSTDPTGVNGGMYYNSSLGTIRCYENGVWRNCGGRDYLQVTQETDQTTNVATNDHLKFDTTTSSLGSSITRSAAAYPSLGRFTLAAGATYKLEANLNYVGFSASGSVAFQWYDVTNSTLIGVSEAVAGGVGSAGRVDVPVRAYITTTASTTVELRILNNVNMNQIGVSGFGVRAGSAIIERL